MYTNSVEKCKKTELFFIKINLYILIFYIEIIQEKKEEEFKMNENEIIVETKAWRRGVCQMKKFFTSMVGKALALAVVIMAVCVGSIAVTQYQAEQARLADEARFTTYDVPLIGIVKVEK